MTSMTTDEIVQTIRGATKGLPFPPREWRRRKKVPKGALGDIVGGILYARENGIITWHEARRLWQLVEHCDRLLSKNGSYLVRP